MKRLALPIMLLAGTAVNAQQQEPNVSSTVYYFSGQEAWDTLSEFGKCYASVGRSEALMLIATKAGTAEEAKAYRKLFTKEDAPCLGTVTNLRVPPALVRGAIAEGLYYKRVPVPAALAVTSPLSPDQVHSLSEATICYAARHQDEAQALVEKTRPGTKAEADAVSALMPRLGECIPNVNHSVSLDTILVRFRIAEALWRLGSVHSK